MNQLNSVIIEGNLTRDPTFKTTINGNSYCKFSIANNRYYKKGGELETEVSFFDVESWNKLAETCADIGCKGRGGRVVGRLKQDRWQDETGKMNDKIVIVTEHVEFRPEAKQARIYAEDYDEEY